MGFVRSVPNTSDVQSRNAQNKRGARSDRGGTHPNQAAPAEHGVDVEPAAGVGFSWERATKHQCIKNEKYALPEQCDERSYFTRLLATTISHYNQLPANAPKHPLLTAIVKAVDEANDMEDVLQIKWIEYGQLLHVSSPDLSLRENNANDTSYVPDCWEMYKSPDNTSMVQAPQSEGGRHYEVKKSRSLPWQVKIVASVIDIDYSKDKSGFEVSDIDYSVCVSMGKRGRDQNPWTRASRRVAFFMRCTRALHLLGAIVPFVGTYVPSVLSSTAKTS